MRNGLPTPGSAIGSSSLFSPPRAPDEFVHGSVDPEKFEHGVERADGQEARREGSVDKARHEEALSFFPNGADDAPDRVLRFENR